MTDYTITVTPKPGAAPSDTYSIEIWGDTENITIAQNIPISDIPDGPYILEVNGARINAAPVADANGPYVGLESSPITFYASDSYDPDGSIVLYEWDLDGDGVFDFSSASPTVAFTWGDDYTGIVVLRVTDDEGLTSIDEASVIVNNVAPTVSIDTIQQPNPHFIITGAALAFEGSFTDPGWLDTHSATWYFDDGTVVPGTLTEENDPPDATGTTAAEHVYLGPGNYAVVLIVADDNGGDGTAVATVVVHTFAEALGNLIAHLEQIVLDNSGTPLADKVEDALANAQTALDELTKTPPDNQAALGNIEGAVGDLEAAVKDGLLDPVEGTQLMDEFTAIARQLVVEALNQAIASNGDQDEINDLLAEDWEHYKNGGCLCFAHSAGECMCGAWWKACTVSSALSPR